MECVELGYNNWSWGDFFKPGYRAYEIYQVLRGANAALSAKELAQQLGKDQRSLWYGFGELVKHGLIVRSKGRVKVGGGKATLFALNEGLIERRIHELKDELVRHPDRFAINGRWRKDVLKLVKESDSGYTPQEIAKIFGFKNIHAVGNTLSLFWKKGLVSRCPFFVPTRIKDVSNSHTAIYGRDMEAVFRAVERYMSDGVKHAYLLVRNDRKVWAMWELKEKTGITDLELKQWFRKAFCKANLINFRIISFRSYYYHPELPEERIKRELNAYQEKMRQQILRLTGLGRLFEQKAIFTFVKYLEAKGQEVKVVGGFPEKIPSWLNSEHREQYKEIVQDEYGNDVVSWKNDVWKFDREPCDYVVFSRDNVMGHRQAYIVNVKKDFSRQYGVGYFSSFIGCVKMGRTKDGIQIPDFLSAIPVFICGETYGKNIWRFNSDMKGQAGIILTLNKMLAMIEKAGVEFPKEHLFQELYERKKVYEAYQNHEDVLLKDKDVLKLMKEKGFKIEQDMEKWSSGNISNQC